MKNLVLLFVFFVLSFIQIGKSQTEKGTFLLGGNASFQSIDEQSILTISPNIGYFFANKFVVGLNAGLTTSENSSVFSLGPNLRRYFLTSEKGSLFALAGLNYFNVNINDNSESDTGFNIGAGYAVFLNPSVALELGANYSKLGFSQSSVSGSNVGVFSINVGFQIHFKK
jgi:opacity protein-like surface antigen